MRTRSTFPLIAGCVLSLGLTGCSSASDLFFGDNEARLEGERISVLELEKSLIPDEGVFSEGELSLPKPWKNAYWPQAGGYPNHAMHNLALGESPLEKVWFRDTDGYPLNALPRNAAPIIVDGAVFTLDTLTYVRAFNAEDGTIKWEQFLGTKDDENPKRSGGIINGGIAFADQKLFATTGYNEVIALSHKNGEILWRRSLPAPSRAAPTIIDGRAFVTTLDNRLYALNAETGAVLWDYIGLSEAAGIIGGASPAANHDIVLAAFSSGELIALRVENGSVAWTDNLSNLRRFGGITGLSDIKAMPVIDGDHVYAMSFAGKLVALDKRTGERIWQRDMGGMNTPWLAGDTLFVLSADNQLVALNRHDGKIHWVTNIDNPDYDKSELLFHGPILAGGRLILAGAHGYVLEIDPNSGEIINQWDSGGPVVQSPIVANNTLYLIDKSGFLRAWR